jgi:Na+-translocating ferredoxin:NAD+ oxidoreductase RNF subunit RnfB
MAPASAGDPLTAKYRTAASAILKAGRIDFPISPTFIDLMKAQLDEEDLDFIIAFSTQSSFSLEDLRKLTKLSEEEIDKRASKLAKKGFIFNQVGGSGVKVYRLFPIEIVGAMEYMFMKPLPKDPEGMTKLKALADLYQKLLVDLTDRVRKDFDRLAPTYKKAPIFDRAIPIYENVTGSAVNIEVNQQLQVQEQILPAQTVEEIINKFEDIALGNCYCRQEQIVLGHKCRFNAPIESCLTFGKSARFTIAQGFAHKINKEEALKILKATEEAGCVHKVFHNGADIMKEDNSICNCCKDCCHLFVYWRRGALPMITANTYLAHVNQDRCTGCGKCVEKCPVDIISLNGKGKVEINSTLCIGCGVCAHICPENTIVLQKGLRRTFAQPQVERNASSV